MTLDEEVRKATCNEAGCMEELQWWEGQQNLCLGNLRLHPAIDLFFELHLIPVEILCVKQ